MRFLLGVSIIFLGFTPCLAEVRSLDGNGNNQSQPDWGAAETSFPRQSAAVYPDGYGDALTDGPNARTVSNLLYTQVSSVPNSRYMSSMVWQWGQFLDHDITLSLNGADYGVEPIIVPQPDPDGMTMIPFNRTRFDPTTGTAVGNPRQQMNSITSYIDASNVYGSDETRSTALRTFSGGRLKSSGNGLGLLPTSDQDALLAAQPNDDGGLGAAPLFVAGDIRANEQPGLTALHTIFAREHNRLANQLSTLHQADASWDDERIYQAARRIVGAELQAITYNEFLPALLGKAAPAAIAPNGYQSDVDASITNEFATAFYRFGHSMLTKELLMMDNAGSLTDTLGLRDAFFRPELIMHADNPDAVLDELMMGLSKQTAEDVDAKIVDDVRSFLFAPTLSIGVDLAALNIQRGRDHGLADYNSLRVANGLEPVEEFGDITSDEVARDTLASLYGDVNNIDAWVGALVEDHEPGMSVGPLVMASLVGQFERLRDGDRFFYTHDNELLSPEYTDIIDLDQVTLSQIIERNTGVTGLAENVFIVPEPSAAMLILLGLACSCRLLLNRRRRV